MISVAYFWRRGLWALFSFAFLIFVGFSLLYLYLESQLPAVETLKNVQLQVPLRIYTQEGKLIEEYGEKRRIPLAYKDIPPMLIHAILATEDQRFFEHPGVDFLGLSRAAINMLVTGKKSQGGSTITMQVARNFFLSRKKTFTRKFNEILLAIKIDRELPKEKILELYLNQIYLGNRAYGVGAAAKVYYGKPLNQLSLAELAMIAGLPQAPSTQNPIANPVAAKNRRNHVLERLREENYITEEQYQAALKEPVAVTYHGPNIEVPAPYVAEMIRQSLYEHFGEKAYTKGYKVYTTIKASLQLTANQLTFDHLIAYDRRHGYRGPITHLANFKKLSSEQRQHLLYQYPVINHFEPALITRVSKNEAQAMLRHNQEITIPWEGLAWARPALRHGWVGRAPESATQILKPGDLVYLQRQAKYWELGQIPEIESALIALNPNNGAIEALVGGFNFQKNKFNHATQSYRQPGSSFKPFIYAAALNKGYTLATLVNDAPIIVEDPSQPDMMWRPHNDNQKFNGPTRLKEALVHSGNVVSIRVLDDIGFDYAIKFLTQFGFHKNKLPRALSLALGTSLVTPLELTTAYAIFANGGYKVEPYLINRITDNEGKILLQAKPTLVCKDCDVSQLQHASIAPLVVPPDIIFLINVALKEVIQHGTAHAAAVLNRSDLAGKTGTTNGQVDAWFSGFNADLVVTTWLGYDQPQSLHEYAANLALPLWIDFMKIALKGKPAHALPPP